MNMQTSERTRCEIWTRVMGYHRPVNAFNIGKQSEYKERVCFEETQATINGTLEIETNTERSVLC